jgi:sugar phosphate isomerase/epimerase
MKLGVIISLNDRLEERLAWLAGHGFTTCQLKCWDTSMYTHETAQWVQNALTAHGIRVSTLWCGWSGTAEWNFYKGPLTLGIVPEEYRERRVKELKLGSDFARKLGVSQIATHVGFIPEDPNADDYPKIIAALRDIAERCAANGQYFLFETGQETPVTLLRTMQDIGTDNLGINLDPANFILYGKANPVDALGILGRYVRDVHAKDGCYPTDGRTLGQETVLGDGQVDFPALIRGLKEVGYDGSIIIEREIDGERQIEDILKAKKLLEAYICG